jgi:hypothetical protein
VQYLNVVGSDGTWLIQDLAIFPGEQDIATTAAAGQFVNGQSYQTVITSDPMATAPAFTGGTSRTLGAPVNYMPDGDFGVTEFGPYLRPSPRPDPPPPPKPGPPPNWSYHPDVLFLQQGPGQCVPTAFAMSLSWLNMQYTLGLGATLMIQQALIDAMNTTAAGGTTMHNMMEGEMTVAQPAGVQIADIDGGGLGFVNNLVTALQTGRDVELITTFLVGSGSHAIIVVGGIAYSSTDGEIAYYDPEDKVKIEHKSKIHIDSLGNIILGDFDSTVDRGVQEWVPEPNTLTLFASGFVLAGIARIYRTNR